MPNNVYIENYIPAIRQAGGILTKKNLTIKGSGNFDMSGSTGTFKLPTGAITFNGNITLAAGETITAAAGAGALDMSLATGVFKTSTGVNTIGGNLVGGGGSTTVDFSGSTGTFKTSTGVNTLGGATTISGDLTLSTHNLITDTTTGTKIGTATTQKLGFYNATPVVQPAASADVTGFVAGVGTASKSDSTWTGASGSSAYTVGGIVTQLKALGLLAA